MNRKREQENARRRYDKYQARQQQKAAAAGRRRRVALVAGAGGAVVALVAAVLLGAVGGLGGGRGDDRAADLDPAAADATGAASADEPGTAGVGREQDLASCPEPGPPPRTEVVPVTAVPAPVTGPVTVTFETTCGPVVAELSGDAAPQAVGNLVGLARAGFLDDTPCHRLTTQGIFVLQCGDPTGTGTGGPEYRFGPIENAPADDVYPAGTLAMARVGNDGSSMGSQFFVVYEDSTIPSDAAGGYSVMGTVTQGLDIVQRIAAAGLAADGVAPAQSVGIRTVTVQEAQ